MPSSPPQFQQQKEGGHESNDSPCSKIPPPPPLEARPLPPSSEGTENQNPMLMLMAGEAAASAARLRMPTQSVDGRGQTENSVEQSLREFPTSATTEFVTDSQSSPGKQHVAKFSALEEGKQKENDISPNATMMTNTGDVGSKEDTDTDKEESNAKKHQSRVDKSFQTESQIPITSTSEVSAFAGLEQHQHQKEQKKGPLSAEVVQRSIMGAVAAVASVLPKESNNDSESESGNESKKMAANNDHPDYNQKPRRKRKPQVKPGQSSGRWTVDEHRAFLEGLRECGREWKKVALRIPTRTSAQIRSHAQKYFSKLQRDHENLVNHPGDLSNNAGGGMAAAEIQQMQPSVQRSADRILANPNAAQREVENTLEALRERYRQLQQRLEQRQLLRSNNSNRSRVVEDDTSGATHPTRKRALEEAGATDHRSAASSMDDQSSVSSAVSGSAASLASARDLGNEELIALSVLGADLARGDARNVVLSPPAPGTRRSPESSDNSSSDSEKSQEQGNLTSNKRHKKEA